MFRQIFKHVCYAILAFISVTHLWAITFIRHRYWQSAEFLDYPLGCDDTPQCARFGSNLFGQVLAQTQDLIVGLYSNFYKNSLSTPQFDEVAFELRSSFEQLTKATYVAILGFGVYLVFRKLLGSPVKSLVALNGLLILFSGSWLPVIIRIVDRFAARSEQIAKLDELLRMQQLEFLMHYDYVIVPTYLSSILVLKLLQDHRMKLLTCFGYAFLLGSIYEGLVLVFLIAYIISSLSFTEQRVRFHNISFKYVLTLITGQAAALIIAYGSQYNNDDVFWISNSVSTYGADNMEYLPQLILFFTVVSLISFSLGKLLSFVLRPLNTAPYHELIVGMVLSLLILHVLGIGIAGYTNEAVRQTPGLQALVFTLGISSGGIPHTRNSAYRKFRARQSVSTKMAKSRLETNNRVSKLKGKGTRKICFQQNPGSPPARSTEVPPSLH